MTDDGAHRHGAQEPSAWVVRFLAGVAPGGHVLDVACGGGRHLRHARAKGHRVTGVDRDLSRAQDLAGMDGVTLIEADLEDGRPFPLAGTRFDGVVVCNYLWRAILGDMVDAVARDGVLIYETFALGHERHGRPRNPDFLLKPNELLEAVAPRLTVVAYEHGTVQGPHPKIVQRLAACGPDHDWAGAAPAPIAPSGGAGL